MKQLADKYGIVKIDAVNCVDFQLGGKGKSLEDDPDHNLMFMGPCIIEFFNHMKDELLKQGMDEALRTFLAASKASYYWTPAATRKE
jgi:hypothetical protein